MLTSPTLSNKKNHHNTIKKHQVNLTIPMKTNQLWFGKTCNIFQTLRSNQNNLVNNDEPGP